MFSGIYEDLDPLETPLNLFEKDISTIKKYKLLKPSNIFETEIEEGGCLYIPQYYWFQTKTLSSEDSKVDESIILTFDYDSSSQIVDELILAVDHGILE